MTIQHPIPDRRYNSTYGLKLYSVNIFISHSGIIKTILKFNKISQTGPCVTFEIFGDTNDKVMINLNFIK